MPTAGLRLGLPALLMNVDLDAEGARKFLKLADAVEELDDVQNVYSNANIPADVMAQLEDDE